MLVQTSPFLIALTYYAVKNVPNGTILIYEGRSPVCDNTVGHRACRSGVLR